MKKIVAIATAAIALVALSASPASTAAPGSGYVMIDIDGQVYPFGAAQSCGRALPSAFNGEVAFDIEMTPDGRGYWTLETDVIGWGDFRVRFHHCGLNTPYDPNDRAYFDYEWSNYASLGTLRDGEMATSMSSTPDGKGYWVFTSMGRVFAYGNAPHYGDMSAVPLNGPVYGSVATPSGKGYYMVASDGGIFAFGDAQFYGSMGGRPLNQPVRSMAPDPDGAGYWLVASDGGIFAFSAPFYGSMGSTPLNQPVQGIVASPTGGGYLMVASDGGIFAFGDVPFHGSLGSHPPVEPVVAVSVIR